jgi:hypothetical protein
MVMALTTLIPVLESKLRFRSANITICRKERIFVKKKTVWYK